LALPRCAHHRVLPPFPTRRSSDLSSPPPRRARWPTPDVASPNRTPVRPRTDVRCTATPAAPENQTFPDTHFRKCLIFRRRRGSRSEEHTSELQSRRDLVCRLLLEK